MTKITLKYYETEVSIEEDNRKSEELYEIAFEYIARAIQTMRDDMYTKNILDKDIECAEDMQGEAPEQHKEHIVSVPDRMFL